MFCLEVIRITRNYQLSLLELLQLLELKRAMSEKRIGLLGQLGVKGLFISTGTCTRQVRCGKSFSITNKVA